VTTRAGRKRRIKDLERELEVLRDDIDRLTTLHLKQAVQLIELEGQVTALRDDQARSTDRPEIDTALAQLVSNLADVRRRLPA
jgi:predicted  nucleic acid-binding Zn-ribbon protein